MAVNDTPRWLQAHVAELARVAEEVRGIPCDLTARAAGATIATFTERGDEPPARIRARSERYFWRVATRGLVRRASSTGAIGHYIVATVVEDLMAAGRDPQAVWRELERGWADKVPREVLEEYRLRLCA